MNTADNTPRWATVRRDLGAVTRTDLVSSLVLGVACGAVYLLMVDGVGRVLSQARESREIGAMWAVVATIFVFRSTLSDRLADTRSRLAATVMSLLVCLVYLVFFPVTAVGIAFVIVLGSVLAIAAGRPQDAALTGITSTVVLIVADLGRPAPQWVQPLLRLLDTAIGIAVGLCAAALFGWLVRRMGR